MENLNPEHARQMAFSKAVRLTRQGMANKDTLILSEARELWRALGEPTTVLKIDNYICTLLLAENERTRDAQAENQRS